MPDNPKARNSPDNQFISMTQDHEVRYWTEKLGVSRDQLAEAVKRVGNSAAKVQEELRRGAPR